MSEHSGNGLHLDTFKGHILKDKNSFSSDQRIDVLFKGTLRAMRKYYLEDFQRITKFKVLKGKKLDYMDSLTDYVKTFIEKN